MSPAVMTPATARLIASSRRLKRRLSVRQMVVAPPHTKRCRRRRSVPSSHSPHVSAPKVRKSYHRRMIAGCTEARLCRFCLSPLPATTNTHRRIVCDDCGALGLSARNLGTLLALESGGAVDTAAEHEPEMSTCDLQVLGLLGAPLDSHLLEAAAKPGQTVEQREWQNESHCSGNSLLVPSAEIKHVRQQKRLRFDPHGTNLGCLSPDQVRFLRNALAASC